MANNRELSQFASFVEVDISSIGFTTSVGIGTTNTQGYELYVNGDVNVSGIVTATTFIGAVTGTATSTTNIPNLTGAIISNNTTTSLGSFTSANLATALTDETGSGANVFATSPVLVTPSLGIATATSINASGIITATQFSTGASGTGVNITTNTISGPATLTIDPAAVGDNTGAVRIKGDLYVDGTQFIVNSTTIELADFNVGIATTVGTNALLDGAGIGIGSTGIRKTLTWSNSSTALKSSEDFDVASGKVYKIAGTSVLSNNTLGSAVVNSSLTSVGTLTNLNVGNVNSTGIITATTFVGALTGTASTTTNIPNLTGDITSANTVTTLATVNSNVGTFGGTGAIPIVTVNGKGLVTGISTVAPNNGTLTLATSGTGISGSASFTANQSGASTFTVTSNATSDNTNSTIVSRNGSGGFVAGIVTATTFVGALTGTATSTTNIPNLTGAITSNNTTTSLGSFTSANLATALTDETGSGSAVFATSPTLVTPVLGAATATSINVSGIVTATTFVGAVTGTATTTTNIPNLTGAITSNNTTTSLGSFTSANLATALTDETGSGSAVFATSPTLVTPVLGSASATSINVSGIVTATTFVGALTGTATSTTNIPNLTGDISSSNTVTTLATVNSNVGTFGGTDAIPVVTVNGKGLVTGISTVAPNNGTLSLGVSGTGLSGSASFTANQSGASTFTVTSNATSANTNNTIVARDGSGNFSAGTITANLTGTATSTTNIPNLTGAITSNNTTTSLGSFTSANLSAALTDETGSGSAVFATSPTLVTPVLGSASATSIVVSSGSTFTNGPVIIGAATSTGTASQPLQVTGGAYVSGNLGVGVTSPLGKLSIFTPSINTSTGYNGQNFGIIVGTDNGDNLNDEGNGIVFTQQYASDGVDSGQVRVGAIVGYKGQATGNFGGGLKFKVQPTGATPMVDAMVLTKDGNLGVGNTNPQAKLDVNGTIRMSAVPGTNNNVYQAVLHQTASGDIDGGSSLTFNPGDDSLNINGMFINTTTVRANANGPLFLTTANASSTIGLYVGTTDIYSKGEFRPDVDNTYNLGSSTFRWANIYSAYLQVTGISTFTNGPVLIGSGTSTGTASQRLQVTGGAYVSGNLGVGNTNPTAKLSIGSVSGFQDTTTTVATTAATTIDSFAIASFRSARIQVQITQSTNYQASDILIIHDGTTASIVEYGSIATNDYLGTFSASVSGGNCLLRINMSSATSSTVKVLSQRITI